MVLKWMLIDTKYALMEHKQSCDAPFFRLHLLVSTQLASRLVAHFLGLDRSHHTGAFPCSTVDETPSDASFVLLCGYWCLQSQIRCKNYGLISQWVIMHFVHFFSFAFIMRFPCTSHCLLLQLFSILSCIICFDKCMIITVAMKMGMQQRKECIVFTVLCPQHRFYHKHLFCLHCITAVSHSPLL